MPNQTGNCRIDIAQALFDNHLFGPEQWKQVFGYEIEPDELSQSGYLPWNIDFLLGPCPFLNTRKVWETHFAFWGIKEIKLSHSHQVASRPLSIRGLGRIHAGARRIFFESDDNRGPKYAFADKTCESRWYLVPLETKKTFTWKDISEQLESVPDHYEISPAIVQVMSMVLCVKLGIPFGVWTKSYRCLETFSNDCRATVTIDDRGNIMISGELAEQEKRGEWLGLAINAALGK